MATTTKKFDYGTAGFRDKAELLSPVMYRMGCLAVLRSKLKKGAAIGIMITASHNPVQDNGVKLIDPYGEMLEEKWEAHATKLANTPDDDIQVRECAADIAAITRINMNEPALVFVGRDTRPSSVHLTDCCLNGIHAFGGQLRDLGLLTTPQLHYMVCAYNMSLKSTGHYGDPTEDGYYRKLSAAFLRIQQLTGVDTSRLTTLKIDGANGVGAAKMRLLSSYLGAYALPMQVYNDGSLGELNKFCGADFVKTTQGFPQGFTAATNQRCCSFDGDADRLMYFYRNPENKVILLDGDKISSLIAGYIKELLQLAGITLDDSAGLGVVQTAYANGSSTSYIRETQQVPVVIAKTGVKHLHRKALKFDIGVYFEANGHGTVIFSKNAEEKIREAARAEQASIAAKVLAALIDLINQTVGDAISDLLVVETILQQRNWTCIDWARQYTDLPNKLMKVGVKDRSVIQTNEDESRVKAPLKLQQEIDAAVTELGGSCRAFVRPSGTEDVVRVYAEADSRQTCEHLAALVSRLVFDICEGQGQKPDLPPLLEEDQAKRRKLDDE